MRPLDESPKVWKFVRANDLPFILIFGFSDMLVSFVIITKFSFVVGFTLGLLFLAVILAYFFLKTIMPTNFFWNYIGFKTTPRLYVPGPEPNEILVEDKSK